MENELKQLREEVAAMRREIASMRHALFPPAQPMWPPGVAQPPYLAGGTAICGGAAAGQSWGVEAHEIAGGTDFGNASGPTAP